MADRMAIMREGAIEQIGPPLERPALLLEAIPRPLPRRSISISRVVRNYISIKSRSCSTRSQGSSSLRRSPSLFKKNLTRSQQGIGARMNPREQWRTNNLRTLIPPPLENHQLVIRAVCIPARWPTDSGARQHPPHISANSKSVALCEAGEAPSPYFLSVSVLCPAGAKGLSPGSSLVLPITREPAQVGRSSA
jgi:hypothetical protein